MAAGQDSDPRRGTKDDDNDQDDRIYAVQSIAVCNVLCLVSLSQKKNKSEMRFRTLLAHGQNYVGVVIYNGHHSCAVLYKKIIATNAVIFFCNEHQQYISRMSDEILVD